MKQIAKRYINYIFVFGIMMCFSALAINAKTIDPSIIVSGSTSAGAVVYPSKALKAVKAQDDGYTDPITFDEYGLNTVITNQYASRGIIFGPDQAFISVDGASSSAPVLSGVPQFQGAISGSFVDANNTTKKIGASAIKMRVGHMDEARTVRVYFYDKQGKQIEAQTTTIKNGFENFHVKAKDKGLFYSWKIQTIANEPAGYAIDDFSAKLEENKNINATIKLVFDSANSAGSTSEPVTGKDITVTVELRDADGKVVNYPFTECKWKNIPDLATKKLAQKEGDRTNSCKLTFQYAKEVGPKDISYGEKTLEFSGKFQADFGEEKDASASYKFKVFFDKDQIDTAINRAPNWFFYWGKNNAVSGLSATNVQYGAGLGGSYGETLMSTGVIKIGDNAAKEHYVGGWTIPAKAYCPGGSFGGVKGIDSVAEVLAHENTHLTTYNNWKNNIWIIGTTPDTDDPTPTRKGNDDDFLPDVFETSTVGTNPGNRDSCDLAIHKYSGYATYGDNEYYAIVQGHGKKGVAANDWANPGAQTNPAFKSIKALSANIQSAPDTTYSSDVFTNDKFLSEMSNITFADYDFLGGVSDGLVDENGDGVADYLSIKVKFNFPYYSKYHLVGYLLDNTKKPVLLATTSGAADAGANVIELRFDATLLRTYGTNGVFYLKGLEFRVIDDFGDSSPITTDVLDAYVTKSYDLSGLPLQAVRFSGENFSDKGIDTNGNGLYEQIEVNVEVEVNKAGNYIIAASVGYASGETALFLSAGKKVVPVRLDISGIVQMRYRDPLILETVEAYDSNAKSITYIKPNYQLKTQGFDKFEKPAVFIDETSFEDYPVDLDGIKGADFIALDVDILADIAGEYSITYYITDKDGNTITDGEHFLEFERGKRRLYLSISTDIFYQKQVNGPYYIKLFTVYDGDGLLVDSLQTFTYETNAYKWKDLQPFEPKANKLLYQGSLASTGASIDENGDVYVWGFRGLAQQGNGRIIVTSHSKPAKVDSLQNIVQLTGGAYHLIALDASGDVWGWGQSGFGETGCKHTQLIYVETPCKVISNIKQVTAGEYFTVALDNDGKVYTWGLNLFGQLGDGSIRNSKEPVLVNLNGEHARLIGGAHEGVFAVTEEGHVYAWGDNEASGLGFKGTIYGIPRAVRTPTHITNLDKYANDIKYIAGGNGWSEALLEDGTVIGWGLEASLGQGTTRTSLSSPEPVVILHNVEQLFARYAGSVALSDDGTLYTWGQTSGSLSRVIYGEYATPHLNTAGKVVEIGGGKEHIFYTTEDGSLYGVGNNDLYKLNLNKSGSTIDWPGSKIEFK
jgi:alpha-tubulin suppressor-like RCC1 family protein